MRRFLQITKRIQVKKKMLIPLAACYLLFMTTVVMTSPTNSAFTSKTTVEGKITINDTSDQEEDAEESEDQSDKEEDKKETEKQDSKKQEEESSSSDEEEPENADSDDETETEDDSDETSD